MVTAERDRQLLQGSGENERHLRGVVFNQGRPRIGADIKGFVQRETTADGAFDPRPRNLLAVNEQSSQPTLPDAVTVVLEGKPDLCSARFDSACTNIGRSSIINTRRARIDDCEEPRVAA
jgi:hypothetical protein